MKTLSIQQPWGSLICCGLKDVENRTWALKSVPMRILIHVGARRQPITDDNMYYPHYWAIENYQKMGILPALQDTPTSAIIGMATVTECTVANNSMWATPGCVKWVMQDVKLFKEPIKNVKGKLGIFDVDLPSIPECVDLPQIKRNGKTITIPLNDELFRQVADGDINALYWNLVEDNLHLFATDDLEPLDTDKLIVTNNGESLEIPLESYNISPVLDMNTHEPFQAEDDYGNAYEWWEVTMKFAE